MQNQVTKTAWILVAGGFHQKGGMDKANYALALYLSSIGEHVFLISHDVDPALNSANLVEVTLVPRPAGSVFLGEFALDRAGRRLKRQLRAQGWRVRLVANGASCLAGDVNWAHYVHSAWKTASPSAPWAFRVRNNLQYRWCCVREKRAFRHARLILANSNLTKYHVELFAQPRAAVKTIYLGADLLAPVDPQQRLAAKSRFEMAPDKPVAVFVGALALDSRKGLDVLLQAWKHLSTHFGWDVTLLVAGSGPAMPALQANAQALGVSHLVRFLGFRTDIGSVLAASDLLVSPVRYEPYGLNVQEALLSGISVLTSACAGVAERFPEPLHPLLISDPESVSECAEKLRLWRKDVAGWQTLFAEFGGILRLRSWPDMARDIVAAIETECSPGKTPECETLPARAWTP